MSSKAGKSNESIQNKSSAKKTIVTRHNSHQMQRQLRNKDRSMKNVTQLLKGTPRKTKSSYPQTKQVPKKSNKTNNKSSRFKLDDITNVPLTKTITVKHRDHIEPTVKINKRKAARPIEPKLNQSIQTKPTVKSPESIKPARPITAKPIIARPIITRPIIPNKIIDTIQPKVTIKCVKRRKIQQNKGKSQESLHFHESIEKRQIFKNDWLKHKHAYKTVCQVKGVVRRKLYVPKQGIISQTLKHRVPQSVSKDLDVKELVQLADDEGLDDDDLMEILTCPSPVWWENGDDEYFEDAIPIQIAVDTSFITDELSKKNLDKSENDNIPLLDVKINKSDQKFMQKRSKLETLLGNMKNTLHLPSKTLSCNSISNSCVNKELCNGERTEKPMNHKDITYTEDACDAKIKINTDEINKKDMVKDKGQNDITAKNVNDNLGVNRFAEVNDVNRDKDKIKMNEDFIENKMSMNKDSNIFDVDVTATECVTNNVDANKNNEFESNIDENSNKNDSVKNTIRKTDNRTSISSDEMFYESFSDEILNDLENLNIPIENKEVIEIIDDDSKEISEPTSSHSTESLTSSPPVEDNVYSISDTNIKFIIDDKNEDTKASTSNKEHLNSNIVQKNKTNDKIRMKIKDTYKELMKNMACNNASYVFAPLNTESSGNNTEANVLYNSSSKDSTKNSDADNDKIKYCFKCSSIFEMDNCQNCCKKKSSDTFILE